MCIHIRYGPILQGSTESGHALLQKNIYPVKRHFMQILKMHGSRLNTEHIVLKKYGNTLFENEEMHAVLA